MTTKAILDEFSELGLRASYHYADDSCGEWGAGDAAKDAALKLFDDNPDLRPAMRVLARDFLWTLSLYRKEN